MQVLFIGGSRRQAASATPIVFSRIKPVCSVRYPDRIVIGMRHSCKTNKFVNRNSIMRHGPGARENHGSRESGVANFVCKIGFKNKPCNPSQRKNGQPQQNCGWLCAGTQSLHKDGYSVAFPWRKGDLPLFLVACVSLQLLSIVVPVSILNGEDEPACDRIV